MQSATKLNERDFIWAPKVKKWDVRRDARNERDLEETASIERAPVITEKASVAGGYHQADVRR